MAIIKQYDKRTGKTYVYESVSYWDKEKQQSRSKRKLIGKIDANGDTVPTHKKKSNRTCLSRIKRNNDEWRTPTMVIEPLLPYIKPNSTIWCPFDKEDSPYVSVFKENGFKVIYSHIDDDKDFFTYNPTENYDYIISNPPYSKKAEILKRLFALGKPFAVLLPIGSLNYQNINSLLLDLQTEQNQIEFLIFDKKISFNGNTSAFNSSYFCHNFLGKQIEFCHLEHNNSGKYYNQ